MKREISLVLLLKVIAIGLNFAGLAALANSMSVRSFGFFAFMFSTGLMISIPSMLGLNFSLVRYTSELSKSLEYRLLLSSNILSRLILILIAFLIFGSIGGIVFSWLFGSQVGPPEIAATVLFGVVYAFSEVLQSVARHFDGTAKSFAFREIGWRASFFPVAMISIFAHGRVSAAGTLVLLSLLLIVTIALQFRFSNLSLRPTFKGETAIRDESRDIWRQSPSFTTAACMSTASQYMVVSLAGIALSIEATAHFFTSLKLMQMLSLSVVAVNFVLTPRLRNIRTSDDGDYNIGAISRLCGTCAWINLLFSMAGIMAFAIGGDRILGLFGPEYAGDKIYLLILCVAALFNAATGPAGFVLVMFDRQRAFNLISGFSMAVGVTLCVVLGRTFGLAGFCWGYVAWIGIQNVGVAAVAFRSLKINATVLSAPGLRGLLQ